MSLFDVDKSSEDRGAPKPNHTDQIVNGAVKAHQTASTTYKTDASDENARVQQQNTRILAVDSDDVPVVSFGQQEDGSLGLRVAKPGVDVTTNSDLSQLIFNSNQNTFKVVATGTYHDSTPNYTTTGGGAGAYGNAGGTIATIPHGLGYIPAVIAYVSTSSRYVALPYSYSFNVLTTGVWVNYGVSVDATNVYISINLMSYGGNGGVGGGNDYKYFLLQETAN